MIRSMHARLRAGLAGLMLAGTLGSLAMPAAAAPSWATDVAGGQDHPLLQRYTDSWLIAYQQQSFAQTSFPGKLGLDSKNHFLAPVTVEGQVTRLVYLAPPGKTPLEVHRNYEQALAAAGFKAVVSCTPSQPLCEKMRYGFADDRYDALKQANFAASRDRQSDPQLAHAINGLGGVNMVGTEDLFFTYGTLNRNGATVHVMVNTGKVYSSPFVGTYIEIAEPKAMLGGQVTVNADALKNGLQAEGKIALYGIYFDTGKAALKPESKAQLDEMARLLKAQPALKVYIVGHTDNQGTLAANLTLSQQRAQAVVDALVKQYQIPAARLAAQGVASLAPVAANAAEAGRAKNRRVELVVQ